MLKYFKTKICWISLLIAPLDKLLDSLQLAHSREELKGCQTLNRCAFRGY